MADAEKSKLKTNIFLSVFLIIIIIITILSILFPNVGTFFAVGNWFPNLEQVNCHRFCGSIMFFRRTHSNSPSLHASRSSFYGNVDKFL